MLKKTSINLINIYQRYIRIILPNSCRFTPNCSDYTKQAILRYGFLKGTFKGIIRLLQCHPFSKKAGYDPLE